MSAKISICIPVKNGGAFLPLAVESVLQQSFDDAELIIVDNCSTDGTTKWLEEKAAATPRIHVHKNPRDIGMTGNFNACLRHAKGEYVKFLCADDLLLPGCLQRMSLALDSDARTTLAVGGRELVDESGEKIAMQRYARLAEAKEAASYAKILTGGMAMYLNRAVSTHPGLTAVYNQHEQACVAAAEGYAKAKFPTLDEQKAAKEVIAKQWDTVVGATGAK